jgi:hypothetical protein
MIIGDYDVPAFVLNLAVNISNVQQEGWVQVVENLARSNTTSIF